MRLLLPETVLPVLHQDLVILLCTLMNFVSFQDTVIYVDNELQLRVPSLWKEPSNLPSLPHLALEI